MDSFCARFQDSIRRNLAATSLALFIPTLLVAQQDRLAGPISGTKTVTLKGNVSPKAQAQFDQSPVDPSLILHSVTIALTPTPQQQAALQQLLNEQQDRTSGNYRCWLTPEEYADQFSLSSPDLAKIREWLEGQGFTIGHLARSRNWISFSGTAAQITRAFHTAIHYYAVDGETHFANATEPEIPESLEPIVLGILGLDDFYPKPQASSRPRLSAGGENFLAPDDVATIYDITRLYQAGIDGSATTLVIAGQSDIDPSDIAAFQSAYSLPANAPKIVLTPGSADPGMTAAQTEADLDIEWADAVARNAQIMYVYSANAITAVNYAVSEKLGPVISFSFGGCESGEPFAARNLVMSIADQANVQGMTWIAASGDSGAAGCDKPFSNPEAVQGFAVSLPASLPEVTAVGGTQFNEGTGIYWNTTDSPTGASALSYIPEAAWNETGSGGLAASGGGFSAFYSQPVWQAGPGLSMTNARAEPDVALDAAGNEGHLVFSAGQLIIIGGTSVATPVFAGMVALLNQKENSGGLGNINSNLYRLAQTNIFHDIITGNNIVPCLAGSQDCANGSFGYSAAPGYDPVTGLGSVDAYNLVMQWNAATPASKIVAAGTPNPVVEEQPDAQGNSWFFTISLRETAGVATNLTGFMFGGTDYSSQIANYFGSSTIPAHGMISANITEPASDALGTVTFDFTGVDAGGRQWSQQLPVQLNGLPLTSASSPTITAVVNAASYQPGLPSGGLATLFGANLSPVVGTESPGGATSYKGVSVTIGGRLAPLFAVANVNGQEQINFQVPTEVLTSVAEQPVQLNNNGSITLMNSAIFVMQPGIFEYFPSGTSIPYGVIVNPDGSLMGPSNPAARGSTVVMYTTGLGPMSPALSTGQLGPVPLAYTTNPVLVEINGISATVLFSGAAPGFIGLDQVNFTIAEQTPVGSADAVNVTVLDLTSLNAMTSQNTGIAVQ